MSKELEMLKEARNILAEKWCRFNAWSPDGGHCAIGAVQDAWQRRGDLSCAHYTELMIRLEDAGRALRPDLVGMVRPRPGSAVDKFDDSAVIFINNQEGKEEILRVFDVAIVEMSSEEEMARIMGEVLVG